MIWIYVTVFIHISSLISQSIGGFFVYNVFMHQYFSGGLEYCQWRPRVDVIVRHCFRFRFLLPLVR